MRWQRLGAAVFSRPAWAAFLVLIGWAALATLRAPDLRPSYHQVFFTGSLTIVELTAALVQIPGIMLHEAAHVLAGRRIGLQSRLSVGRRFNFVVFETSLRGLVAVPRRQRYLPILAGPLLDLLLIAGLTLFADASRLADGRLSAAGRLCLAISFTTLLRLVWQLYLHLRTDGYFLFSTVLGCFDLHNVAWLTLRNRVYRWLRLTDRVLDESAWHPVDRRAARWYSLLLVVGYALSGATLALAVVPTAYTFLSGVLARLVEGGPDAGPAHLDAAVFLALNLAQFVAIGVLAVRDHMRRRQAPRALAAGGVR